MLSLSSGWSPRALRHCWICSALIAWNWSLNHSQCRGSLGVSESAWGTANVSWEDRSFPYLSKCAITLLCTSDNRHSSRSRSWSPARLASEAWYCADPTSWKRRPTEWTHFSLCKSQPFDHLQVSRARSNFFIFDFSLCAAWVSWTSLIVYTFVSFTHTICLPLDPLLLSLLFRY